MLLRPARFNDYELIANLYKEYDFVLETKNLESLIVVESSDKSSSNNSKIIAVGGMVRLLEASFLTTIKATKKERIIALDKLVGIADAAAKRLGYNNYHAFGTNPAIVKYLKKRLDFRDVTGQALIRWVD